MGWKEAGSAWPESQRWPPRLPARRGAVCNCHAESALAELKASPSCSASKPRLTHDGSQGEWVADSHEPTLPVRVKKRPRGDEAERVPHAPTAALRRFLGARGRVSAPARS